MTENKRLDSWKEIGAYLDRDERTVRRWEKLEGLPVHRQSHQRRSSVYAYTAEIEAWRESRRSLPEPPPPLPLWKTLVGSRRSWAFGMTMALSLITVGNGLRPQRAEAQAGALTMRLILSGEDQLDLEDISRDGRFGLGADWSNGDLVLMDMASGQRTVLLKGRSTEGRWVQPA